MSGLTILFIGIVLVVLAFVGLILIGAGIVASEGWSNPEPTGKKFKKSKKRKR